ncbi:hypothetical protein [Vulcanisaeta thermophila]|uniref:hypothetical protein n=1 Tax=Vulcanisaeta thermophila TaxID=867917 RepID=UPI0008538E73|nr:hypothetical protein [Vulcanisaeta thermophila]
MRIYVRWCGFDWCMFAGTWLLSGVGVTKYVKDATPVAPLEPIAEVSNADLTAMRGVISRLRGVISLATAIAWAKKLGFRVFVTDAVLSESVEDFVRAALAGNVDGLISSDGDPTQGLIGVVNTRPSGSSPGYLVVSSVDGLPRNAEGVYGVVLTDPPMDTRWLLAFRERVRGLYGNVEFLVFLGVEGLSSAFLRGLVGVVDGVVINEVPILVSLGVDGANALNVFRCVNCYVDYMSGRELRKCPRCGGKLRPVIKSWGSLEAVDPRIVRLKARDEISLMRDRAPGIVMV